MLQQDCMNIKTEIKCQLDTMWSESTKYDAKFEIF